MALAGAALRWRQPGCFKQGVAAGTPPVRPHSYCYPRTQRHVSRDTREERNKDEVFGTVEPGAGLRQEVGKGGERTVQGQQQRQCPGEGDEEEAVL